uniref:Rap-GAP domain-containing protein n=1 Tax=Mesocestoides corti TaxID=53468 RepID=A0A5K3FFS1_MESCO
MSSNSTSLQVFEGPHSNVLTKEDRVIALHALVETMILSLKDSDDFKPLHPHTVSVFKFILSLDEERRIKPKIPPPSAWFGNRISGLPPLINKSGRILAGAEPGSNFLRRSLSVSPKSLKRSFTSDDLRSQLQSRAPEPSGKLRKASSMTRNTICNTERALRLATTLLSPSICYLIASLTAALRSLREGGEDGLICSKLASHLAPVLFPANSQEATCPPVVVSSDWKEAVLATLFSVDADKCIAPSELVKSIVNLQAPSQTLEAPVKQSPSESMRVAPLRSALSRLNINKTSIRGQALPDGSCHHLDSDSERVICPLASKYGYSPSLVQANTASSLHRSYVERSNEPKRLAKLENTCELLRLLNTILDDRAMDPKMKMNCLRQFQAFHGDVFWLRFGNAETADRYFERLNQRIANAAHQRSSALSVTDIAKSIKLFRKKDISTTSNFSK